MTKSEKIAALQAWLIAGDYPEAKDIDEIEPVSYEEHGFAAFGNEYLVLTDDEADLRAGDYIRDSLWAFNPSFLLPLFASQITELSGLTGAAI